MPSDADLSVVVLTALEVEYRAVRSRLQKIRRYSHPAGTQFEIGRLPGTPGNVVLAITGAGNQSAAVIAERAIDGFRPAALLMVGVAGALHSDLMIGDVVVATKVYAYHGGKDSAPGFQPRPQAWPAAHELVQLAHRVEQEGTWQKHGRPAVYFRAIAAGEVVLDSRRTPLARQLRTDYDDAAAVEMESAGVAQAAHLNRSVPLLVVRGISDLANGTKRQADAEGGQSAASENAAAFALAGAREILIDADERSSGRSDQWPTAHPWNVPVVLEGRQRRLLSAVSLILAGALVGINGAGFTQAPAGGRIAVGMVAAALGLSGLLIPALGGARSISPGGADSVTERSPGARTIRNLVLERVYSLWIDQALHHSLKEVVRLEVGLDDQLDAVADPWASSVLETLDAPEPLPEGTRLADVFGRPGRRRLLLVGAPGAGKTTHLLELAEHLIARTRADPGEPIPLVLRLSEWTGRHTTMDDWLIEELGTRYLIPVQRAQAWLAAGTLTLLLDGLDEVARSRRKQCMDELDAFCRQEKYATVGVVVTCRLSDYELMRHRLPLDHGLRVRPLQIDQVEAVLRDLGPRVGTLRQALRTDVDLADLLTTPLMLSVAVLATSDLPPLARIPADRLWSLYIVRMLSRIRGLRGAPPSLHGQRQIVVNLIWLARLMTRTGRTAFYLDAITPKWLPGRPPPWPLPRRSGPVAWLAERIGWDHASATLVGAGYAGLLTLISGAPLGAQVGGWWGALAIAGISTPLVAGLVALLFGFVLPSSESEPRAWLVFGKQEESTYSAARWTWSPVAAVRGALLIAVAGGVVVTIGVPLTSVPEGVACFSVIVLGGALSGGNVPDHNEPVASIGAATSASLRRFCGTLALLALLVIVGSGVTAVLGGPWSAAVASLPLASALTLVSGPGRAWLRNQAAHFGLTRSGLLPRDVSGFLQRADERILLRRAGGGFQFVHRTMQEFLVDQDPDRFLVDELSEPAPIALL